MIKNTNELAPDVRALQLQVSSLGRELSAMRSDVEANNNSIRSLLINQAQLPAAPVANLLYNGELGHSNFTWFETVGPATGDKNEECAWWYSHMPTLSAYDFVDAAVNTASELINLPSHGYVTGTVVTVKNTGGALPGGLSSANHYWVIRVDAHNIQLAARPTYAFAGTPVVNITSNVDGGTHTIQPFLNDDDNDVNPYNNALKSTASAYESLQYGRWNATNGWAELTGTSTLDALLPSNLIDATTPLARVGLIAAKASRYIDIPAAALMGAGIWDNTDEQRKFLAGSIAFTAEQVGTAASTIERRYRLLITSDRGYSLLSDEVTLATAPADGFFSSTVNVVMSWPQQAGQLQAEIYEYLPGSAAYRRIAQISGATSYIHLGSFLNTEVGYPTPTGTTLSATYFTRTGEMSDLATNGVSAAWSTIIFPIAVPSNYDKSNTTDRQWLRLWMTVEADLLVDGVSTNGTTTITAPTAAAGIPTAFATEYQTLFPGMQAIVYDENDTVLSTTTVSSWSSETEIVLGASIATGTNRKVRITAGGFHGILVDKIHLGYHRNTSYAPNANDTRTLQPRAAPTSSTQGGVGTGDGGDYGGGIRNCVAAGTPVKLQIGIWKPVQTTRAGQLWSSGGLRPNTLVNLKEAVDDVRRVGTENGCEIECTDTERFVTSEADIQGTPLSRLRVGDYVMTEVDGRIEASRIESISAYLGVTKVYTPTLANGHLFIAGKWRPAWWQRLITRFWHKREVRGGFVLHNLKIDDPYLEV